MLPSLPEDWWKGLNRELSKPYFCGLCDFLAEEYKSQKIFPPEEEIFTAFYRTPVSAVRAVILGQDPYHNDGQAMGMSFSVKRGVRAPASLQNIYKEIADEYSVDMKSRSEDYSIGDLSAWASQGVLLLNTVLTVRAHTPKSHRNRGWEQFTDACIRFIDSLDQPIVFLLWGRDAQEKRVLLTNPSHLTLTAAHPSPYSASSGFFGCGHFKKANEYLLAHNVPPIDWTLLG